MILLMESARGVARDGEVESPRGWCVAYDLSGSSCRGGFGELQAPLLEIAEGDFKLLGKLIKR